MEIKKIFINFQFDNQSLKALEFAKDLASKYGSELVIFYEIVDVYMMKRWSASFGMPIPPDLNQKSKESAQAKLDDLMSSYTGKYKYIIDCSGRIKDVIGKFIQEENPDLVVLTDEYEYLNKKANCSVLIVK
ncbi:MAG: universal stress protein [Hydrogenothermaceae bacterium]